MNEHLNTLLYLEEKLLKCGNDFDVLRTLSSTDFFRELCPGTELEIQEGLNWLEQHKSDPFPNDVMFDEGELRLPSRLYGNAGEERGAKHENCKEGRKLCGTRCIPVNYNCKYDESHKTLEAQKFSVKEASGLTNSLPKETRDKFVKKFPAVFEDPKKEEFLWHLMYSSHTLKDGSTLVPRDVLYRFAKDRNGEKFLSEFQEAMGNTPRSKQPYFSFKDYSYKYAKAREAKLELPASLEKSFKDDLRNPDMNTKRVFVLGGAEYNEENIRKVREIQRQYALEVAASLKIPEQRIIATYHANQRAEDMPKYRFKEAYQVAESIENVDSRETALRVLNNIRTNPVGYYRPSDVTTRMFSANHLQGLKSEVRAALVPEMAEMDLISAHLGIMADLRDNDTLKQVMKDKLERDESVWDKFQADFKAAGYPWDKRTKKAIKEQFYALSYGGTRPGAVKRLNKMAAENPEMSYVGEDGFKETLFNNFVFKELQDLGDTWRKEMIEKGEACNVFGQCFTVNSQKKARSVQSAITQSYETALVTASGYPTMEKMEESTRMPWTVVYFGHDGLGVIPKKGVRIEDAQKLMSARMNKKMKELGIPSAGLEIKPGDLAALEDIGLTQDEIEALSRGEDI